MDNNILYRVYNATLLDSEPLPTMDEDMEQSVNISKAGSIVCFVVLFYLVCYICFEIIKRIKRRDSYYDATLDSRCDKDALSQKRETFKKLARIICVSDVSFVTVFCATGICILVIR